MIERFLLGVGVGAAAGAVFFWFLTRARPKAKQAPAHPRAYLTNGLLTRNEAKRFEGRAGPGGTLP